MPNPPTYTAFSGQRLLAHGAPADVALAVHEALAAEEASLVFDDLTGRVVDLDLRGSADEVVSRLAALSSPQGAEAPRQRGRPRLGVVPREVTLLPRHWEWLGTQPGGASAALRRLVDEARQRDSGRTRRRAAQERTYRFLSALAGDLPRFEEVIRALFADDIPRMEQQMAGWPPAIADYALRLSRPDEGELGR